MDVQLGSGTVTVEPTIIPHTGEPSLRFSINKCIEWSVKDRELLAGLRDWLNEHVKG